MCSCHAPSRGPYYLRWHDEERCDGRFCYCCLPPDLQVRVFFNGLGRSLLLMYNLLLILLTLKGEHVDRDLTCEGSVGFDVMNTKLRGFFRGVCWFCFIRTLLSFKSNLIHFVSRQSGGKKSHDIHLTDPWLLCIMVSLCVKHIVTLCTNLTSFDLWKDFQEFSWPPFIDI